MLTHLHHRVLWCKRRVENHNVPLVSFQVVGPKLCKAVHEEDGKNPTARIEQPQGTSDEEYRQTLSETGTQLATHLGPEHTVQALSDYLLMLAKARADSFVDGSRAKDKPSKQDLADALQETLSGALATTWNSEATDGDRAEARLWHESFEAAKAKGQEYLDDFIVQNYRTVANGRKIDTVHLITDRLEDVADLKPGVTRTDVQDRLI